MCLPNILFPVFIFTFGSRNSGLSIIFKVAGYMQLVGRNIEQLGSSNFLVLNIKRIGGKYCPKKILKYEPDMKLI